MLDTAITNVPLTPKVRQFSELLDMIKARGRDAGLAIDFTLEQILAEDGLYPRCAAYNAFAHLVNAQSDRAEKRPLPILPDALRPACAFRNLDHFIYSMNTLAMEVGWLEARVIPDEQTITYSQLEAAFSAAGISFKINPGLISGTSHEAGVYRVRLVDALNELAYVQMQRTLGSNFAAASDPRPRPTPIGEIAEHLAYSNPDEVVKTIAERGRSLELNLNGDFS